MLLIGRPQSSRWVLPERFGIPGWLSWSWMATEIDGRHFTLFLLTTTSL